MRKLGMTGMVVVTLAACGAVQAVPPTTQSGLGIVTGFADACAGGPSRVLPPPHITVFLYSGATVTTSETIRQGSTYQFSVAPGVYGIKGPGGTVQLVALRAGRVVRDNIQNQCR